MTGFQEQESDGFNAAGCIIGFLAACVALVVAGSAVGWCVFAAFGVLASELGFGATEWGDIKCALIGTGMMALAFFALIWWAMYKQLSR